MNETLTDVILILERYKDNITARRWLKSHEALQEILDHHLSWNADHIKFNAPEMVFPLETNVVDYINNPCLIDNYLRDKKEQPE